TDNVVWMDRVDLDSSTAIDIWQNCSWEVTMGLYYSVPARPGLPTNYWLFALTPDADHRFHFLKVGDGDVVAIVEAGAPDRALILYDKVTGECYPVTADPGGKEIGRRLLSRCVVNGRSNPLHLASEVWPKDAAEWRASPLSPWDR